MQKKGVRRRLKEMQTLIKSKNRKAASPVLLRERLLAPGRPLVGVNTSRDPQVARWLLSFFCAN
jgi:hypothetical protein